MTGGQRKIIGEIKRVARKMGVNRLTRDQFSAATGISTNQVYSHFKGFRDACELAGLKPHMQNIHVDDQDLFEEMRRVFIEAGGICTRTEFDKQYIHSVDTLKRRFGKWTDILSEFRRWIIANAKDFPYLDALPAEQTQERLPPGDTKSEGTPEPRTWLSSGRTKYGAFLNFRGLPHEPVNEQGVVFLFGMVCRELGIVVERIQTGFPDCEAKRCTDNRKNQWERVNIEFEFRASNAKCHPLEQCHLVVCWENDWPDCPIEALELKSAIKELPP